jgi:hypothetical protein
MRIARAVKLILLVVLGLLTSWTTSSIVGQLKAARLKRPSQQAGDSREGKVAAARPIASNSATVRRVDANAPVARALNPQEVLDEFLRSSAGAEATLLQMEATTNGRNVVVSQSVRILEKSPNAAYVWALRVYREATKQPAEKLAERLLLERYYVNQIFQVPANVVQMQPTFREAFELEPGVYYVRVALHRIRPNFDLRQVTDQSIKQFKDGDGVTGMERIVIAN